MDVRSYTRFQSVFTTHIRSCTEFCAQEMQIAANGVMRRHQEVGLCLQHRKSQETCVARYVRHVGQISQIDLEFFEFTSRLGNELIKMTLSNIYMASGRRLHFIQWLSSLRRAFGGIESHRLRKKHPSLYFIYDNIIWIYDMVGVFLFWVKCSFEMLSWIPQPSASRNIYIYI